MKTILRLSTLAIMLNLILAFGVSAKTVNLAWDASTGPGVAGYKVYYAVGSSNQPFTGTGATQGASPIDVGLNTTAILTGLADGDTHFFTVTAYNSSGVESSYSNIVSSAPVVVTPVNRAPVLSPIGNRTVAENALLSFTISGSDPDGDTLTYSATGLPSGATFNAATRQFNWTSSYTQAGSYSVTFRVSDGQATVSETITITVTNVNRPPVINGSPTLSVTAGQNYLFVPSASDPDGDTLTFTISNKPTWAQFTTSSGRLSGTPQNADAGVFSNIVIRVSDGQTSTSLPAFSIQVLADGSSDTDQPNEPTAPPEEPQQPAPTIWQISALAEDGGYIIPAGDHYLEQGQSLTFTIAPKNDHIIKDVKVNGRSVGTPTSYTVSQVDENQVITASFAPITSGLSLVPNEAGIPGIRRADGGSDANNLVNGQARANLDFIFQIALRDNQLSDPKVYLILNDYALPMKQISGNPATGAIYELRTPLGPAPSYHYSFEARRSNGDLVWSYPAQGEIAGPQIYLLKGRNVIGVPAQMSQSTLGTAALLGYSKVLRWNSENLSNNLNNGSFVTLGSSEILSTGQGSLIRASQSDRLSELPVSLHNTAALTSIELRPGWNLITNPYPGALHFADLRITKGAAAPVSWQTAVSNNWVVDGFYSYLGDGVSPTYAFTSVSGAPDALLLPWVGYWMYLANNDAAYSLVVPRPMQ